MSFSPAATPEGFEPDPTGIVSREQLQQQAIRRVGDPAPAAPVVEPVVAPVVEPVAPAPVEVPEQRYVWQPKDENGRAIGGKQVYVYRAPAPLPQDILEQVTKGHEMAIRALRKSTRENALGPDTTVDDAEKFTGVTEFKSRELTADERFNLSQKIANPETASEAVDLLIESAFGAKPSVIVSQLNETQKFMIQQRAVDNYVEFVSMTPDYFDSPSNRASITKYMGKRNWAPTVANFNRAFQQMVGQVGLLDSAPELHQVPPVTPVPAPVAAPVVAPVAPAVNTQPPAATTPGLGSEPPQTKRHSHVPSGLTPSVASTAGDTPVGKKLTVADLEKIPADQLRRNLADPAFRKLADEAYEEAEKAARAKRLARV